jgi:hypothetical protein
MAAHVIAIERRQHPREGILGQLEDITYTVLRKYGITGEVTQELAMIREPQHSGATQDRR